MATQIQLRRGTAANWTSVNPTLAIGELGLETDTGKFKVGTGVAVWTALPYASGIQGPTGPIGATGATGATGTNGTNGTNGINGAAATIAVGTTTTGTAAVTNSGSSSAAVFDFTVPQGVAGAIGATGSAGPTGAPGIQTSATAPVNTSILWADTTTTGAAGTVPSGGTIGQVLAKNSGTNYDTKWASVGSAARPLLTSGAYLSGSGLVLGGITANYASTPDTAPLDITGDIDIQCKVSLDDWTPAGEAPLVSKFGGSLYAYELRIAPTGKPYIRWSPDGAAVVSQIPTAVPSVTDGQTIWVRATRDATTGTATFYTSPDGATWTQLGAPVAGAAGSIYSSVNPLFVGARTVALESCSGTIYRAIVKNGIAGTTVFDADFSTQTADALAFTESSVNAATVTINTTRYSYGIPNLQGSSIVSQALNPSRDFYLPFSVTKPIIVDMFLFEVVTGPASASTTYLAIYNADDNLQPTGSPIATADQAIAASTAGVGLYRLQITPVTLPAGNYVIGLNNSVQTTYRTIRGGVSAFFETMGATPFISLTQVVRAAAAFPASPSTWNERGASNSGLLNPIYLRYKAAT